MSGTLVGPMPVVRFGTFGQAGQVIYSPPRDTLDVRYALCTDPHVACDCREAEWAEERQERRLRSQEIREAFDRILAGHSTFVVGEPNRWTGETDQPCMCTGCQIARELGIYPARRSTR